MPNLLIAVHSPDEDANIWGPFKERLETNFPDLKVRLICNMRRDPDEILPHADWPEILVSLGPIKEEFFRRATQLKWHQSLATTDNRRGRWLREETIATNVHGLHGRPVSEAVMASMLGLSRDLMRATRDQDNHLWTRYMSRLLYGKTVGILGVGIIAETLAPKCKAFGMKVIGITKTPRQAFGFDEMRHARDLEIIAPELDYLVLLAPGIPENDSIVNSYVLAAMKPTSYLLNYSRGSLVDQDALVKALQEGTIAGAALDATTPEPLPADHRLWDMNNVLITAHRSGIDDEYSAAFTPIVEANLRHYLAGDFEHMVNVLS